jgi:hypothetical protein
MDSLYISRPLHGAPKHGDSHYPEMPLDVTSRAQRAGYGRPNLLPMMNWKPTLDAIPGDDVDFGGEPEP